MRPCVLVILFLGFATPAAAQQLKHEILTVQVRIPDVMRIEVGEMREFVRADGKHARQVTLLVTANRAWRLDVRRSCGTDCSAVDYALSAKSGSPGNSQSVVVERVWEVNQKAPPLTEFEYLLTSD